jgi:uncharacterized lipoprotein YmbA
MSTIRACARVACGLLLAAGLLGGCARTPPARYYLLDYPGTTPGTLPAAAPRVGLGPLRLPTYLDRPQIVTRVGASRLELSNQHRWAEPLQQSFTRALHAQLSQRRPTVEFVDYPWPAARAPTQQIRLEVLRFERAADGRFVLSARWDSATSDTAPEILAHTSEITIAVTGGDDDYEALVAAASKAIGALADEIAAQLAVD